MQVNARLADIFSWFFLKHEVGLVTFPRNWFRISVFKNGPKIEYIRISLINQLFIYFSPAENRTCDSIVTVPHYIQQRALHYQMWRKTISGRANLMAQQPIRWTHFTEAGRPRVNKKFRKRWRPTERLLASKFYFTEEYWVTLIIMDYVDWYRNAPELI